MTFVRTKGHANSKKYIAGAAITEGEVVKYNGSGSVIPGTSNAEQLGTALETVANGEDVLVEHLGASNEQHRATVASGTASDSLIGVAVDLASATGLALGTTTNGDFTINAWEGSSGTVLGYFNKTSRG